MVEVFKTNVYGVEDAAMLIPRLAVHFPGSRITLDLEDCDKVLRIEGADVLPSRIITILNSMNYQCHVLE